jgi:DNA-binding MarR family transcriptional regulator
LQGCSSRPDAIRIALAVSRPAGRALLIAADNSGASWVSIEAAVASGQAYAVELRRDVFATDGDHVGAEAATAALARSLRARGLEPLVVPSGQPGRWHLFCRVASVELRRRLAQQAGRAGLDVRRCIRPPWSPHRLGLSVAGPTAAELEAAVAALGPRRSRTSLSAATQRRLRHGDPAAPTRSECDWSVALGWVNAGRDEDDLYQALMNPNNAAGAKTRELAERCGIREARRYVKLRYQRATAYVAANPPIATPTDARGEILAIYDAVDTMVWAGQTGDSDRAVFEAECLLRLELGRLTASASERQIAERAGMTRPTVAAARRRLQARGLLQRVPTDRRRTHAATWRLCPPRATLGHAYLNAPNRGRQGMVKTCTFDVWRHPRTGGLGKGCWRIWRLLDLQECCSAEDLARDLDVHPSTARRRLTRLAEVGLARRLDDGGWVGTQRSLDEVARELGVDAVGARQRARHDEERDAWERAVTHWRAAHLADEAEAYLRELDAEERDAAAEAVAEVRAGGSDRPPAEQQTLVLELPAEVAGQRGHGRKRYPSKRPTAAPGVLLPTDADLVAAFGRLTAAFGPVTVVRREAGRMPLLR